MTIDRILTHILIFLLSFVVSAKFLADFLQVSITSLVVFTYAASVIYILFYKSYHYSQNDLIFVLLLLLGFISAFLFSNEGLKSYGFNKVFLLTIYIVLFILNKDIVIKHFHLFIKYFVIIYALIVIVYVFSSFFSAVFSSSSFYRLMLTEESSSIVLSNYFFLMAIAILYLYVKSKKTNLILISFIGFLVLTIVFGFLTGSRGPLVSFIFSALIIISLKFLKNKKYSYAVMVLSLILISMNLNIEKTLYTYLPKKYYNFLDRRYFTEQAVTSIEARYFLYNKAITGFVESDLSKKIVGNGSGQFSEYMHSPKERLYPHNIFLELLFEYGIIVTFVFIYITLRVLLLFLKRVENLTINQLFLHWFFLFSLFRAMFSSDIAGNCFVFVFLLLILRWEELDSRFLGEVPIKIPEETAQTIASKKLQKNK